ncbi:MAG: peptidyl-prolyl cis-trans isomerase [Candidatus Thiodiazotropha sp. (ex Monitilora ramsayi)]|nr:peptidyl-prolyl cis-trans isomerase [Candidatus Thiodiazotropha sp. (ex Monitilora ramsayi)]
MKVLFKAAGLLLIASFSISCSDSSGPETTSPVEVPIDKGELLATVDGVQIYEMELHELMSGMFGEYRALTMDDETRRRALDSLIASHALAREAETRLDREQLATIDIKTRQYRENLLVNTYMRDNVELSTINDKAVAEYYQSNLELFGKKNVKQYRMLTSRETMPEDQRNRLISVITKTADMNLEQKQTVLDKAGFNFQLSQNEMNKDYLDEKLYAFIDSQPVGQISNLTFIGGMPYVVEVMSERELQPRPLTEVKETIRKSLVLARLKMAIKEKSAEVMAKSSVVYNE